MGAIASGGILVLNHGLIAQLGIPTEIVDKVTTREQRKIESRERFYHLTRPAIAFVGRTVILVDDGLATGASMLAAVRAVRESQPKRIIAGVPVGSREACEEFRHHVDDLVCAEAPELFETVGEWYEDFSETSDREVRKLLKRAAYR